MGYQSRAPVVCRLNITRYISSITYPVVSSSAFTRQHRFFPTNENGMPRVSGSGRRAAFQYLSYVFRFLSFFSGSTENELAACC
jgi:hypothetical protein